MHSFYCGFSVSESPFSKKEGRWRDTRRGRKGERERKPGEAAIFNPIKITSLTKIIQTKSSGFTFYEPENRSFFYVGDPKFDLRTLKEDSTSPVIVMKFSKNSKMEIIRNVNVALFENQGSSYVLE